MMRPKTHPHDAAWRIPGIVMAIFVFILNSPLLFAQDQPPTNQQLLNELDQELGTTTDQDNLELLEELNRELDTKAGHESNLDLLDDLDMVIDARKDASKDDLLDLLDEEIQEENEESSFLRKLKSNLGGRYRLQAYHYWNQLEASEDKPYDTRKDFYESLLELSTWAGGDGWRFDVSGWLEFGNADYTWAGISPLFQDDRLHSRYLQLNEMYLRYYFDNFDLTLGKKKFQNGIAALYSPANRYAPKDLHNPLSSKEFGIWQIRNDYYWNDITLTGAILPVFQNAKIPSQNSRWLAQSGDFDFSELGS
ncbi:hypothetical protein GF373_14110, partial [bacterium]|nr:hypothetical protein [bacterium]